MACLKKRGKSYQIQYYVGGKQRRVGLGQIPLQLAKEKLRQFESAQARGDDNPFPTKTPISEVVNAYVEHIRLVKTPKSAQTDVYYLREMFGVVCPALAITSRKTSEKTRKKALSASVSKRQPTPLVEATCFEAITTAQIAEFISTHTRRRALAPKTANRYREIIVRLFNWAMKQYGVRMPGGNNPAAIVERYRESAPEIRYLTHTQIDEQFTALKNDPQLQAMVAVLIYAGLRRAELLWLTLDDVSLPPDRPGYIQIRSKTIQGNCWEPKTKSNRVVPISVNLRRYLDSYTPRPAQGDWFFPSPNRARWDEDNFSARLREINKIQGIQWSSLDYRHTFGSHLAQSGVSLYKISKLMGNSPEVCRRHYASLSADVMLDDVNFSTPLAVYGKTS